jgi:hypothetical protein
MVAWFLITGCVFGDASDGSTRPAKTNIISVRSPSRRDNRSVMHSTVSSTPHCILYTSPCRLLSPTVTKYVSLHIGHADRRNMHAVHTTWLQCGTNRSLFSISRHTKHSSFGSIFMLLLEKCKRTRLGHNIQVHWTSVGICPLKQLHMMIPCRICTNALVPRTAMGARPLKRFQLVPLRGRGTRPCAPRTTLGVGPLEYHHLAFPGCRSARVFIPGDIQAPAPIGALRENDTRPPRTHKRSLSSQLIQTRPVLLHLLAAARLQLFHFPPFFVQRQCLFLGTPVGKRLRKYIRVFPVSCDPTAVCSGTPAPINHWSASTFPN